MIENHYLINLMKSIKNIILYLIINSLIIKINDTRLEYTYSPSLFTAMVIDGI